MNKWSLTALLVLLLLVGGVTATAYRWVDESGRVHYGDRPPAGKDAQPVAAPQGPSQQEVDRARQQMRIKLDKQRKSAEKEDQPAPKEKASQATKKVRAVIPENITCYAPLSDLVQGPSGETYTPITPTPLSRTQQKLLIKLLSRIKGRWRGTISHLGCKGAISDPKSWVTTGKARTVVDWNERKSRLTIETDYTGKSGAVGRLFHNIEVGDVLYFTGKHPRKTIARKFNAVEVLISKQNMVSFLTKRRKHARTGGGIEVAQVRQLEISGRTYKLRKLLYHMGVLAGSTTWVLRR